MFNNIKGLAIDFDEVMVETIDSLVNILNKDYNLSANSKNVRAWNLEDVYPTLSKKQVNEVFEDKRFFDDLKLKPNLIETLKRINENYPIIVVTLGSPQNLLMKRKYIKDNIESQGINLRFFGLISDKEDKSKVNLDSWVFVDDNQKNLEVSNASKKVLFENRKNAEWNYKKREAEEAKAKAEGRMPFAVDPDGTEHY